MIETKNTIIYNRYKNEISPIHNHTIITAAELIIDKVNNVNISLDFKKNSNFTTSQTRKKSCTIRTNFNYLNLQIRILIDLLKD